MFLAYWLCRKLVIAQGGLLLESWFDPSVMLWGLLMPLIILGAWGLYLLKLRCAGGPYL